MRAALKGCTTSALLLAALNAHAISLFDPALKFRQLPTEHFVIYFHQGEDRTAARLAMIAEETWRALERPLGVRPPRMTRVVLADQTEQVNGYATPIPYDTIVLFAAWPTGAVFDVDDWLRLAFTHEFTHIVHLDRSEGWARVARGIFGRTRLAFPNLLLPVWQIEGLATYEESAITGEGRLHAGDFRAIVDEAARTDRLEPIDRASGGLTDWPGGSAAYAYGLGFHDYLAKRFGTDSLATLADATARSVPYTGSRAFKKVYGASLGDLWRDWETSLRGRPSAPEDSAVRRLTHHGFEVSGPRFDRSVCATCPPQIFYSTVDADRFPALYAVTIDGPPPRRIARRYLGGGTAIGRDRIYFDQLERRRNSSLYSDLYQLSRADGRVRAITSESRLQEPDLSPDGTTLACVQNHEGRRDLVTFDVGRGAITTLVSEPETQFNGPRFSPDGRSIAVERHRPGALTEVIVVDATTKAVRVVASDPHARAVTPAWRPDGRALVVAVAPHDDTFNLHEYPLDGSAPRQLTHVTGGATAPDVSPDGKTIVFVGYTVDGYDLFTMPYAGGLGTGDSGLDKIRNVGLTSGIQPPVPSPQPPSVPYSPLPTLRPTSWSPVFEATSDQIRIGASLNGFDVLGYHGYVASATWRAVNPDAPTPSHSALDWEAQYLYTRWRPTLFASASTTTSFFAAPPSDTGVPTPSTLRARELSGGIVLPIQHVRVVHQARASIVRAVDEYTQPDQTFSRDRTAARLAWQTQTARIYGYSISPEDGMVGGATVELVRRGLGAFADATTFTADARAFLPGLAAHHVFALRAAGGTSNGEPTAGRTFLLGGPGPDTLVTSFGTSAVSLLRGFGSNSFAGRHVALMNADYRFPLGYPQRGAGAWPAFLHTIHGAVFADLGHAWSRSFDTTEMKTSIGAELSAKLVIGYYFPLTVTAGAAWGHDGAKLVSDRTTFYFRVGRAF